jgi:hypothetical protein
LIFCPGPVAARLGFTNTDCGDYADPESRERAEAMARSVRLKNREVKEQRILAKARKIAAERRIAFST